jgi:hypothetical protein
MGDAGPDRLRRLDRLGRPLSTPEAVRVLVESGRELAAVHAHGQGDPAADVADLGRAVEVRLGRDVPDLLRRLLATCRCPDPTGRPSAEELVELALRIGESRPPVVTGAGPRGRTVVTVVVGLSALVCAAGVGRIWAPGGEQPTALRPSTVASNPWTETAGPSPHIASSARASVGTDWTAVLVAHDRARERTWATGRGVLLAAVDAPRSPAERHDVALLHDLHRRGVVARGWHARIDRVTVVSRTSLDVLLRVRDRLAAYRLVGHDGDTRHRAGPRGSRWWLVHLRWVAGTWLTWSIEPVRAR